jgi:hypothetical protein
VALGSFDGGIPMTPSSPSAVLPQIRTELLQAARTRHEQLLRLPLPGEDRVAAAHRASVERILDAVHSALDRLADGSYGECARCRGPITVERLVSCPWVSDCHRCSGTRC